MDSTVEGIEDVGGYDSDTGFSSDGSLEVTEDLENRGLKRNHSEDEIESETNNEQRKKKVKEENEYKRLHKPPTAEELNHLKETQNLFHSNLFRLQIDEMLKEVQIKEKRKLEFDSWCTMFKKSILNLKDNVNKYEIKDQEWLKAYKIKIPIAQNPYEINGSYQFKKPSGVRIIGAYEMNLAVGPKVMVDVLVEMPQSFFQKEDFMNCRYHRKRALYLCELVYNLKNMPKLVEDISYVNEEIDSLKPKAEIIPVGKFNKYFSVMLHVGAEKGSFKLSRFSPCKNNVRQKWFFGETENNQVDVVPTPFYNSTVLTDLIVQDNMQYLKETLLMHNNIKDGIILLKIWLRQRELGDTIGGFNGFLVTLLVAYLLQIKKINVLMSSYQVFRNVCHYLVGCNWATNGIIISKFSEDSKLPSMEEFHKHHNVVFIDASGYHNLCFAMSLSIFNRVQREAQFALDCLNNPNINSFQVLFITKVPFYQHYDHMVVFNNGEVLEYIADSYCSKEMQLNYCTVNSHLVRETIISLLFRGLRNRITHICPKLPKKNRWKIEKKIKQLPTLIFGFNLDPNNYFSVIDKALESETEEFRKFWGDKSELRRFKDGTITEAVVWNGRSLAEKRLICKEIVSYLLKIKFGLESTDFQYLANQLDSVIAQDVEEASLAVLNAYDELMKQLRDLNDLPLDVVTVQGTSPVFRYTEVFPPVPQKQRKMLEVRKGINHAVIKENLNSCPPWVCPIDVTIKMGASSKWPQDLEAIRRIRAAFNIKISESLLSQQGVISEGFQDRIELIKNGFVFRIRVVHPNEIALLKRTVDDSGLIKYKDTEKSFELEKNSLYLPKLSSALHGLYQEHNSFGPACCLIKRWISSHLIDSFHMSEESIELLVASLYLRPQPHEPPCQPQVAFFRFHYLLATTNWNTECIILNMNDELTRQDIMEIESEFNEKRHSLPPLFIATPYDRKKSVFTKDSPSPLILLRLTELCANALAIIESQIYSKTLFEDKVLFQPCYDSYDGMITLDDLYNPRKTSVARRNVESQEDRQNIPINGFDPVALYLQELRDHYGDFALFFHDTYGGSVIALIWKPNALEPCDFKVSNIYGRFFNSKTKKLELNKDAILEDFWHVGKGVVKRIDVKIDGKMQEFVPLTKQ